MDRLKTCNFIKTKLSPRKVSCKFIRISSAFSERANTSYNFGKIVGCALQGSNVIRMLARYRFFSQKFFLRQLVFRTYSENNLWLSRLIVELQSVHCRFATFLNKLHHRRFSEKFPNIRNQSFCVINSSVSRN